ncbi:MAG: MG2 domain-containing protein, partial [Bacteroidia bacterium]|nr:MG2 domain-containing protein [Bacteroidia bacterium]
MKKLLSFTVLAAVLLAAISACNNTRKREINPEFARYISAFTYGNVSTDAYIQIELTQEIPAVELNAEVEEQLFSFSPSLNGHAFWVNNTTVRFLPDAGELKPGREYQATFHLDKILKVDKEFSKFDFYFRVNEQNFTADVLPFFPMEINDLTWNTAEATMHFSNPVTQDDALRMLEVKGAQPQTRIRVTPAGKNAFRVSIDSLQRKDTPSAYTLVMDGNAIGAKKKLEHEIEIPAFSKEHFQVADVRMVQQSDPHIRVTFSDPVSQSQDLTGLIVPSGVNNFTHRIEKNVIKIYPETFPQTEITLEIHQGIRNTDGLRLDKSYTYQLKPDGNRPEIRLEKSGNILPNSEQLMLPFRAVNLWAVDVKVIKVYQNNILYYLQSTTLNNNQSSGEVRRFGRLVMKKRVRLDSDKSVDLSKWSNFSIDLSEMIQKDPGAMYMVQLSMQPEYSLYACGGIRPQIPEDAAMKNFSDNIISEEDEALWDETNPYYYEPINWAEYNWEERDDPCKPTYFMNRQRVIETAVMASNVGIIAKGGNGNKITVAVTDILSTSPLSGADVTVYNYQMQAIGKGKTDGQGFAEIEYKNGRPFVVTAANGKDIGYLEVREEQSLSLSNFDVSGKEIQKGLKGYVYGERGVWRPGDTIYLSFILEDKAKKLPEGHPVTLEVYTPTRQFYHRQVKTKGENGFYTFQITTDPSAPTGMWQSYVKVGGTSFYKPLRIETVKPNRLKVRLETDSIIDASRGVFSGTLTSQWLHGAPASNLKSEVEITLSRAENPFAGYNNYVFNNPLFKFETNSYKLFEGTLNASGVAGVNSKIPVAEAAPGMLRGNIVSRVFETGGDMSFYAQTAYYSPYSVYAGVKTPEPEASGFLETDKPIVFDVVTVNPRGQKVSRSNVEYKIYKLNWSWWWNSSQEDLGSYVNNTAVSPVANGVIS